MQKVPKSVCGNWKTDAPLSSKAKVMISNDSEAK